MDIIEGKKILMVIAPEDFRDEELFHTKEVIEDNGGKVTVTSVKMKEIKGMMGASIVPDFEMRNVSVSDYDALVFIGGKGAEVYFKNSLAHKMAQQAVAENKLLCAICIAPTILANAGVLKDKNATVFMGTKYESALRDGKAVLVREHVVQDGKIITADGPRASRDFGVAIVRALAAA